MATTTAPTSLLGHVDDVASYAGLVMDLLEYVPDLAWPLSVTTYSRMRTDPQLAGVLAAYSLPLRRAAWAIDPAGARPEVARLVADDLGLPVLGDDQPGAVRRRGVSWAEHVRLAVLHLVFGHMPFELQAEIRGGQARLVKLAERMPTSVTAINVDTDGSLRSIQQGRLAGMSTDPEIKADRLVWYAHEREGASWAGRSVLRPAFGPWLLKHEMWRVHGTSIRRFGMGVPGFEPLPGTNPTVGQLAEAQRLASAARVGDTSGYAAPPGFQFKLTGLTGSVPDALGFISYLDRQMSRMALAGILDLGDSPNGSRALGGEFVDLFLYALQAIADSMAATATEQIAVRLVDWNYGENEPAPRVVAGEVGAERQVTAEALGLLLDSGALSADPALESYVRQDWKLPQRDPDAPPPPPKMAATSAHRPARKVAAAMPLRRQPTEVEAAAKTDFVAVQQTWTSAVDRVVQQWQDDLTPAQVDDLVAQVEAAVAAGDVQALATLTVDTQAGAELLAAAMTEIAAQGAQDMADEADAQDVPVDPGTADSTQLAQVAQVTSSLLGAGLASLAARTALQHWGPGLSASSVAGQVRTQLESLTGSSLADGVGSALSVAQSAGRMATLRDAPTATYVASEILDANTCATCQDIDGHTYGSLAAAENAYASGGYAQCEGGLRCRGIIVAVWSDAAKQAA